MKILGICGSPRPKKVSGTYRVLSTLLEAADSPYELVSLGDLKFSGCTACLKCVNDNICKLEDDLQALREKIVEADALVIGSPNYFSGISSLTLAFFERLLQFRHMECKQLWLAVGVGAMNGDPAVEAIEKYLAFNFIKTVDKLSLSGNAPCLYCGNGRKCMIGFPNMTGIECPETKDVPDILNIPGVREKAIKSGKMLGGILKSGYDRRLVAMDVQEMLAERMD